MKFVKAQEILKVKTGKYDANHAVANGRYKFFTCAMEASNAETYSFDDEVLILPGNGANVGEVMYHYGKLEAYQRTYVLHEITENVRYLLYYFKKDWVKQITKKQVGSATNYIKLDDILSFQIPLPPLSTQKAIAEKLDKADSLRKKDKELLAQYDELAQAIFIDMFGDPVKNEKSWEIKSLDEVCNKITDGEHGTVKRLNSGYLYLMARNIRNNEIDFSEVSYISEVDHNKIYRRCNAQVGDILLICVGATIGRTCIVPKMQEFSLARSVALLKPNKNKLNSQYLNTYLSLDSIQLRIKSSSNTSAQAGLYTGAIKEFKITIPPIKLQTQFAEKIQNIEAQKAIVRQQAQQSEDLFQALLQESFNF